MQRLRSLAALLALALYAAPTLGVAQEATPAPACSSADSPAAGALGIADGAVEWSACSPDEAYRYVIGASDDIVLVEEIEGRGAAGTPAGRRTVAFDAADGSERWRRSTTNAPIPPGPIDGQGTVVLAADDQDVPALVGVDPATGAERWRVESGEAPLAHGATVAVVWDADSPGGSSQIRGIDRATGDALWVSGIPLSN